MTREITLRRQSTFVKFHKSSPWSRNLLPIWLTCFFRQFGQSVVSAGYLTLRAGFIMNHHLASNYDFHSYMIRSMEEEFKMIVGVRLAILSRYQFAYLHGLMEMHHFGDLSLLLCCSI